MAIFGPKPCVNPFGKMSSFPLLNFMFLQPRKDVFFVLDDQKRHFPCLFCLKKKFEKWPFLDRNHVLTPLVKCQFFHFFELYVFRAQKGVFFVLEYHKRHFPGLYCLKKKVGKMAIFGPKPWINPFGKMSIFCFCELYVFIAQKGDFSFYNIIKDIFLAYIA